MAVAHDGEANVQGVAAATSITLASKTTAGTNRCGIVHIGWYNSSESITGVTWGGSAMTHIVTILETTGWGLGASIYRIIAPATASSSVVVTFDLAADVAACASSYTGVDQTTPISNSASMTTTSSVASPATLACTSASGEMVADAWSIDFNNPPYAVGAGQTEVMNGSTAGCYGLGSYEASTGASVTMSWTFSNTCHRCGVAASLKAAAAAATPFPKSQNIRQAVNRGSTY